MLAVNLFISGSEIFIILLVVLLLFGANKLPEIARGLGKGMNEFKRATQDIRSEFDEQTKDIQKDVKELKKDIEDQTRFDIDDDLFDKKTPSSQDTSSGENASSGEKDSGTEEPNDKGSETDTSQTKADAGQKSADHSQQKADSSSEPKNPDDPYGLDPENRQDEQKNS